MQIINLSKDLIDSIVKLYMDYCNELKIRMNNESINNYLNKTIDNINNGLLDFKILIEDDIPIGFASVKSNFEYIGKNDGFILDLYIKDDYRFYGYGKKLLTHIEELSNSKGTKVMYVTSDDLNALFFKNCGYLPTGIFDNEVELEVFYKNIE